MEYKPLIIQSDFDSYCRLSNNIKKSELDIPIKDAQLELLSWIPDVMYTDLMNNLDSKPELTTLFNEYIKPVLVLTAYYKFILWHGRNISQFGIRQNNEDTSEEISDKARGELMADVQSRKSAYLNVLKDKMDEDNYTYDSVEYNFYASDNKRELRPQLNIRQLGRKRYIKKGRGFNGYPQS